MTPSGCPASNEIFNRLGNCTVEDDMWMKCSSLRLLKQHRMMLPEGRLPLIDSIDPFALSAGSIAIL